MLKFFLICLSITLIYEGGYTNLLNDPGGETNRGVTQTTYNYYRKSVKKDTQSVKFITKSEIKKIYYKLYYLAGWNDLLPEPVAIVHFDTGVNFGVTKSMIFLKKVLNYDGKLHKDSIKLYVAKYDSLEIALKYIDLRKLERYAIVDRKPKSKRFLKGWLNRDNKLEKKVKELYDF